MAVDLAQQATERAKANAQDNINFRNAALSAALQARGTSTVTSGLDAKELLEVALEVEDYLRGTDFPREG